MKSVKDDKDIFTKLKEKSLSKQNRTAIIKQQILYLIEQRQFIDSNEKVRKYIDDNTDLKPKKAEISTIMKDHLHMSFKKIRRGPVHLNSIRNLICRQ